ncbi:MAG: hypothetical protein VST67_09980, partial [Nitrospirota bacterium]|nr:hypothetical protein [Nitrospirota bacterium]
MQTVLVDGELTPPISRAINGRMAGPLGQDPPRTTRTSLSSTHPPTVSPFISEAATSTQVFFCLAFWWVAEPSFVRDWGILPYPFENDGHNRTAWPIQVLIGRIGGTECGASEVVGTAGRS